LQSRPPVISQRAESERHRVDLGIDGPPGNGAAYSPMLTEDGRVILLVSTSTNVGSPSSTGSPQVYLCDRFTWNSRRARGRASQGERHVSR